MVKIVEEGAFRAEVDVSDLENVKIAITMTRPLFVSEYQADSSPWNWAKDIAKEAYHLFLEVNACISKAWKERKELRKYAV